ncbi:DUF535 family protein [Sphingomonas sp. 8AM]|uniref:DUF535 family protein n=1 Tax=Sphingomonas sp. 8AM TaxID=2653170 RepID=UPI00135A8A79|nr:DUF535 family protein [Sphingomonas sp. 8AM]
MLRHPGDHLRLYRTLSRARAAGASAPRASYKYVGQYLAASLTRQTRLAAILHHHDLVARLAAQHGNTLWREPFVLWQHDDEHGRRHAVSLHAAGLAPMEGECELAYCLDGKRLFTLTFAFVGGEIIGEAEGTLLFVGGLQGAYYAREELRYAARANGEIAAPTLLLLAAAALAEALGIVRLAGPSRRTQASATYVVDGRSSSLDYDELWAGLGGEPTARGFFIVDSLRDPAATAEVSGKHRSRTRRRRRLRAAIRAEMLATIQTALNQPGRPARPGWSTPVLAGSNA